MNNIITEIGFNNTNIEFFGSKFCIGNGYFGYRGCLEEFSKEQLVSCTLSEIYDDPGNGWRELINIQNPLFTTVIYNNETYSVLNSTVNNHYQSLNLQNGLHTRHTQFLTANGKNLTVHGERFASIANKNLLLMRYSVISDDTITIDILTKIDKDIWDINGPHFSHEETFESNNIISIKSTTIENAKTVAVSEVTLPCHQDCIVTTNRETLTRTITVQLKKDEPFYFDKLVSICKSTDSSDVLNDSIELCKKAAITSYDSLLIQQNSKWLERWADFNVTIEGDDKADLAMRYSLYLLLISAPFHTSDVAIPARGLSGQVYKGAMFWDTEIYMLQCFAYSHPATAKNLIKYRIKNLQGALEKAQEYGYKGAFYPWESQETGKDGCTHYNLVDIFTHRKLRTYFRDKQIHISADVVYGIMIYMQITGDKSILLDGAAEVILECARFFYSYAYFKKEKNRYELLDVTCADEYHERVNNNTYTNYMVKLTLECALDTLDYLENNHLETYHSIIETLNYRDDLNHIDEMNRLLYLPKPNSNGIIEQFDDYFKGEDISLKELYSRIIKPNEYLGSPVGLAVQTQIIKQADVILMLTILGDRFKTNIMHDNFCYYEPRTEHGSSLSACAYALHAAKIGYTDYAYKYFMKSANIDLEGNYKLYLGDLYIGGTHPAANGGTWQVAVLGFGGLNVTSSGVTISPNLPKHWNSLTYNFSVSGNKFNITITQNTITLTPHSNNISSINFTIHKSDYICNPNEILTIPAISKGDLS